MLNGSFCLSFLIIGNLDFLSVINSQTHYLLFFVNSKFIYWSSLKRRFFFKSVLEIHLWPFVRATSQSMHLGKYLRKLFYNSNMVRSPYRVIFGIYKNWWMTSYSKVFGLYLEIVDQMVRKMVIPFLSLLLFFRTFLSPILNLNFIQKNTHDLLWEKVQIVLLWKRPRIWISSCFDVKPNTASKIKQTIQTLSCLHWEKKNSLWNCVEFTGNHTEYNVVLWNLEWKRFILQSVRLMQPCHFLINK